MDSFFATRRWSRRSKRSITDDSVGSTESGGLQRRAGLQAPRRSTAQAPASALRQDRKDGPDSLVIWEVGTWEMSDQRGRGRSGARRAKHRERGGAEAR